MRKSLKKQIEGYTGIKEEIEILKKYPIDRAAERGQVQQIINRLHPKTIEIRVSEIRRETRSTATIRLVAVDDYLPPFLAGQYLNLFVEISGIRTSRPYSISSPPNQTGYYDITVRSMNDGFVSNYILDKAKVGDIFQCSSPSGHFYHHPLFHGNDLVFLAGGTGITPFISMIREVVDKDINRRICLIYGSRVEDDIVFRAELEEKANDFENLTVHFVISEASDSYHGSTGLIDAEFIQSQVVDLDKKIFYICGPEVMYTFILAELQKLGIPGRKIRTEVFGTPSDIRDQPGWPEAVKGDDLFHVILQNGKNNQCQSRGTFIELFGTVRHKPENFLSLWRVQPVSDQAHIR